MLVPIIISILVILISIVIYLFNKRSTRQLVLLVGLSESGKTTLFTQLAHNSYVSTVTSMCENEVSIPLKNNKSLILVDLPGFDRLRNQFWEKFKFRAKCIIYVIDSSNFLSNVHNVADLLYQYLCDDVVISNRLPVLVACTKQDETRAKSSKVISATLEKEFNTIRETRMGALDTTAGDGSNTNKILGNPDSSFKFSDLKNQIEFIDCSSSKDHKNVQGVLSWLNTIA